MKAGEVNTMKVLLINGSPNEKKCTYTALSEIAHTLESENIDTELFHIGKGAISGCIGCGHCENNRKCLINDGVDILGQKLDNFDGLVIGSPVYYGGPTGQLTAFLDRLFNAYSYKMTGKLGACIVSCRRGGASAAFDRLNKYFTISNMHVVSSQYWNQVHGFTAEDVHEDKEGLQTMRTLGQNMAWLLKCIEAGNNSGIQKPVYEAHICTNFIMPK